MTHLGRRYFQVGSLKPNGSNEVGYAYTGLGVHGSLDAARRSLKFAVPGDVVFMTRDVHAHRGGIAYGLTAPEVVYRFTGDDIRPDLRG